MSFYLIEKPKYPAPPPPLPPHPEAPRITHDGPIWNVLRACMKSAPHIYERMAHDVRGLRINGYDADRAAVRALGWSKTQVETYYQRVLTHMPSSIYGRA